MSVFAEFIMGIFGKNELKNAQKKISCGKSRQALSILEKRIEAKPADHVNFLWLAIAKTDIKDLPGALEAVDKALSLKPGDNVCKMIKGEILLFMERLDESITFLSDALEANPDNTRTSYLLGLAHLKKGDTEKASSLFELAIKYDRELVDSRLLCAAEMYLHRNKQK